MLSWNDCVDSEATETAVSRLCVRMLAAWKLRATGINDRFVQIAAAAADVVTCWACFITVDNFSTFFFLSKFYSCRFQ